MYANWLWPPVSLTRVQEFHDGVGNATSSPEHHQSNGKAEVGVKITKTMMCKALRDGNDQYAALLELRNTPRQDTGISPAEFMFGKNTRSLLPSTGTKHNPSKKQVMMKRAKRRLAIRSNYNKGARDLTPSQPVYYQYKEGRRPGWRRDTVRTEHSERSYIIDRRDGVYRRNSAPTPYNTWDVTREILLSGFCVEFTQTARAHGHWEVAGCHQTEQVSSRQSDKAAANQDESWLVQRLRVQLLASWTFAHVAKN